MRIILSEILYKWLLIIAFTQLQSSFTLAEITHFSIAYSGYSGSQRNAFIDLGHAFEQENPDVYVKFITREDSSFKNNLDHWIGAEDYLDAIVWHGGERLYKYVRRGGALPITDVWQTHKMDSSFSKATKDLVSYENEVYAIPITYYQWGFYYNKKTFQRLRIQPPQTWTQFLAMLEIFKQNKIAPITIGTSNAWTIAAWFEFINLRLNGLKYHREFLAGNISPTNTGIQKSLEHFNFLVENDYFVEHHNLLEWQDVLPDIFRERAGITLLGNFVESIIPPGMVDDVGYFPFPVIDSDIEHYELAPTDVVFIPKTTRNKALAKKFAAFLARPDVQERFNQQYQQIPPNNEAANSLSRLSREGKSVLSRAQGFTQYLDRDMNEDYATSLMSAWIRFLEHKNLDTVTVAMKNARTRYLSTLDSERK